MGDNSSIITHIAWALAVGGSITATSVSLCNYWTARDNIMATTYVARTEATRKILADPEYQKYLTLRQGIAEKIKHDTPESKTWHYSVLENEIDARVGPYLLHSPTQ